MPLTPPLPRPALTRPALDLLVSYARAHRDQRNITTHLAGVPMVVFGAALLLAPAAVQLGTMRTTLGWLAFGALWLWMLSRGQIALGLATTAFTAALAWAAHQLVGLAPASWPTLGLALLFLGWLAHSVGHYYEGRRPVFADDPAGPLVAPMFVVLELLAMAGLCRPLMARVEQAAGPATLRDLAQPLAR
ncbi:MAG: DUF962 domain-containing protein [Betaproteobacteria bacterium]|nr:DUF962 domain-containing protein [Betaproteobacteria bacterium]MCC6246371.1 DUF962 domain-containing protein [Rubrivivax sp.]MCL4698832.1 DUF962 domain-containing protein [Burkholderiaceae bacterium]